MDNLTTQPITEKKHHKTLIKKIGIFMDHTTAHLIEYTNNPTETNTIESDFTTEVKLETLSRSENIMHNKEQQQHHLFYKEIADAIISYDEVLLFGPTNAKVELANILKENQHFNKTNIVVQNADKMSENQQHAYVKEYFS